MNTAIKILIWVIGILIIIGVASYFYGKSVWEKIVFGKPKLTGLDLQGLTLADFTSGILTGQSNNITLSMSMDIANANNFSIPVSGLKIKLFYNNKLVAQSSELLKAPFEVSAKSNTLVSDIITVDTTASSAFLIEKVKGNSVSLIYTVDANIFGIPISKIYPIKETINL